MLQDFPIHKFQKTNLEFSALKNSASLWEKEGFWTTKNVVDSANLTQTTLFYIKAPDTSTWASSIMVYNCIDYYDVLYIYTHPSYRHQGLASLLLKHLVKYVRYSYASSIFSSKFPPYIHLEVKTNNFPAIDMYEQFGFKKITLRKKYYSTGEDAIIYRYEL